MDINLLLTELRGKYTEIISISNWHSLRAAQDLDQINAILDRRGILLKEIQDLGQTLQTAGAQEQPEYRAQYEEMRRMVQEVLDSDKGLSAKIQDRMKEIKEDLKAKTLFRTRALPGYIKQKYAFSR